MVLPGWFGYDRTMNDGPDIARVAAAIGDHARARVLTALMADRALTASELGNLTGVTKSTISAHLAKLLDVRLIAVEQQGRHRYFRLADDDVGKLLESLMGVAFRAGVVRLVPGPREAALRKARVCYDHLAGEVAVAVYDNLMRRRALQRSGNTLHLTGIGREWFSRLGVDVEAVARQKRQFCRPCLDWSERRTHLAGGLGRAFLERIEKLGWARRVAKSRLVSFSQGGERALQAILSN
jgi:DNA-binding transcriptional ArsR family regulator